MKKLLSIVLVMCLFVSALPFSVSAAEEVTAPNPEAYPEFANSANGALYAHATLGGESSDAWQRWYKGDPEDNYDKGMNFEDGVRYFFLPKSADDNRIEIYNNYGEAAVTIGDVVIESYTSAFIDYIEGEKITAIKGKDTINEKEYAFVVYKSDAEASVYVNDTTNSYVDYNGVTQNTDLWSFLIKNKENSVSNAACSIVDESGVFDTTLKKIKGRGNTNWRDYDKKPFNLTFNDKTNIGGVIDKKFSFVSNAKDSTLIRNSIMYDLAYNVGSPYASDQSFVDFFVNGAYRGSYIACQKIDLGKNSVVSLKDNSDDMDTGFNFLVEVDVWNYGSDVYFVSDYGYPVVLKTPDLEDYDETDPSMKAKYNYIRETYQKFEDALYTGTLEDIEKICDLDSLASQYLLQEFGKNCDGGYTSTFFTYNADEDKFYAAPIWDCDSDLGAVSVVRSGCSTSTIDHTGWITRLAEFEGTVNPLGQAFYVDGKSSDGKTFEEICAEIWSEKFIPMIDVLLGNSTADGRLKSIDEYASSIEKSAYINYVRWNFAWLCSQKNSSLGKEYSKDYAGEIAYLKDWTAERAKWMSYMFDTKIDDSIENAVYFTTELGWEDVHYYAWGSGYVPMKWPGEKAQTIATSDETGCPVYKVVVPEGVTKIIFNNGTNGEQTVDITLSYDKNLYSTTAATGEINEVGENIYNVSSGVYVDKNVDITISTSAPTGPIESTIGTETTAVTTDATEPSSEVKATDPVESSTAVTNTTAPASGTTAKTEASQEATSVTITSTVTQITTTPAENLLFGDVNLDGKVNIKDATTLQKHLAKMTVLEEKNLSVSDTNRDGRVTIADVTTIQKKIAGLISWK